MTIFLFRSLGSSSLLTVSDLEEDLRAASAFLSSASTSGAGKRTSSVFTDSMDDLSSLAGGCPVDDPTSVKGIPSRAAAGHRADFGYEKDIRDIVDYFEATCKIDGAVAGNPAGIAKVPYNRRRRADDAATKFLLAATTVSSRGEPVLQRSQKIDRLIKRVVEKESRDRLLMRQKGLTMAAMGGGGGVKSPSAQVCDGIVRSKLPIFDATRRSSQDQNKAAGFVKSKLSLFDAAPATATGAAAADCASTKKMAERRLAQLMAKQQRMEIHKPK